MTIYLQNRDMIAAHNARFEKGEVSYSMKMNQFGDMLPEEFEAMQTYKPRMQRRRRPMGLQLHQGQPRSRYRIQLSL